MVSALEQMLRPPKRCLHAPRKRRFDRQRLAATAKPVVYPRLDATRASGPPPIVEFFSREGHLLGSKKSLEKLLSEITGIPLSALRGTYLTFFTVAERMSWAAGRQTTRDEDTVYSLLGLFDVYLPAIYGEGPAHAMRRLQSEIEMHPRGSYADQNSDDQPLAGQWVVPFDRNTRFTDRELELARLRSMLFAHDQFTKVAVSGLGGVGKTQLVLELLYRLRENNKQYSAIWIQATTIESLNQGYHALAQRLGIRGAGAEDVNMQELVQKFLSEDSAGHWILVFDNADDIDMWMDEPLSTQPSFKRLIDYVPRSKNGRVIFTTRNRKVAVKLAHQNVIEVGGDDRRDSHTNAAEFPNPQGPRRFPTSRYKSDAHVARPSPASHRASSCLHQREWHHPRRVPDAHRQPRAGCCPTGTAWSAKGWWGAGELASSIRLRIG